MAPPPQLQPPNQTDQQQQQQQQQHPPAYLTTILNNAHPPTLLPETIAPWTDAPTAIATTTSTSTSTPPRSTPRASTRHDTSAASTSRPFDETRRGLQARGKNYNVSSSPSGASNKAGLGAVAMVSSARQYEERQRRDEAVAVLESEEMVMWIAASRNESVPQTRAHYRNIVLGLAHCADADVAWREEWEVPVGSREGVEGVGATASPARSAKGKEREIARMRKRVSSGQGQA